MLEAIASMSSSRRKLEVATDKPKEKMMSWYEVLLFIYASGAIVIAAVLLFNMIENYSQMIYNIEEETGREADKMCFIVCFMIVYVITVLAWPIFLVRDFTRKDERA